MTGGDRRSPEARERYSHRGNAVWEYRQRHGMSQAKLAKLTHYPQQHISEIESGKARIPQTVMAFIERSEE